MAKRHVTTKGASRDAVIALGQIIRILRKKQGITIEELARRSHVSKQTMINIEKGSPGVAIGNVFNAAVEVDAPLFSPDEAEIARLRRRGEETLSLMPARVEVSGDRDHELAAL